MEAEFIIGFGAPGVAALAFGHLLVGGAFDDAKPDGFGDELIDGVEFLPEGEGFFLAGVLPPGEFLLGGLGEEGGFPALAGLAAAAVIDEDVAHGEGGQAQEMFAVEDAAMEAVEAEVEFGDQAGGLDGTAYGFVADEFGGDAAQGGIDEAIGEGTCGGVAILAEGEQLGEAGFGHGGAMHALIVIFAWGRRGGSMND